MSRGQAAFLLRPVSLGRTAVSLCLDPFLHATLPMPVSTRRGDPHASSMAAGGRVHGPGAQHAQNVPHPPHPLRAHPGVTQDFENEPLLSNHEPSSTCAGAMAESCFSPALAAAGIFTAQPVTLPPRPFGNAPRPRTPSPPRRRRGSASQSRTGAECRDGTRASPASGSSLASVRPGR